MKSIKEFLHLYLGCDVVYYENGEYKGFGVNTHALHVNIEMGLRKTEVKPILRPLSSMTEEEAIEMYDHLYPDVPRDSKFKSVTILSQLSLPGMYYEGACSIHDYKGWFPYLLSRGFDLFDLIPSGLAIDGSLTPIKH
jgi:hypothetical protein